MSIIKELFLGNIRPDESFTESRELRSASRQCSEYSQKLSDMLTGDEKALFENIRSLDSTIVMLTAEEYFAEGFKLGASLTAAAVSES